MTLRGRVRRRSARRRGQSLVEFALVLPIFLVILFGLIDLGRAVYLNSTLSQAAREGARLASVEAYWVGRTDASCGATGGPVCPADLNGLQADVLDAANRMMEPFGSIAASDIHLSCDATTPPSGEWTSPPATCANRDVADLASVRVEMEFESIIPIIGRLMGSIPLSASATMAIN
jgi:TadE-like protein